MLKKLKLIGMSICTGTMCSFVISSPIDTQRDYRTFSGGPPTLPTCGSIGNCQANDPCPTGLIKQSVVTYCCVEVSPIVCKEYAARWKYCGTQQGWKSECRYEAENSNCGTDGHCY